MATTLARTLHRLRTGAGQRGAGAALPDDDPAAIDAAIARVLDAESRARDRLAADMRACEAIVDDARQRARAIGERAEARSRKARAAFEAAIARDIARIDAEVATHGSAYSLDAADRAHVARAVARLADDLAGRA